MKYILLFEDSRIYGHIFEIYELLDVTRLSSSIEVIVGDRHFTNFDQKKISSKHIDYQNYNEWAHDTLDDCYRVAIKLNFEVNR